MESAALKASLGMTAGQKGVLVRAVAPLADAARVLKPGDVIMKFDGVQVASDGTVPFRHAHPSPYLMHAAPMLKPCISLPQLHKVISCLLPIIRLLLYWSPDPPQTHVFSLVTIRTLEAFRACLLTCPKSCVDRGPSTVCWPA